MICMFDVVGPCVLDLLYKMTNDLLGQPFSNASTNCESNTQGVRL